MTGLDGWLKQATRHLSRDSAAQVRTEIQEHYESALEAAMSGGASTEEADRLAVTALGDAKDANCKYRNVLLTSAEARMLREGNWDACGLLPPMAEMGRAAGSRRTISYGRNHGSLGPAGRRNSNGPLIRGAIPAGLHSLARAGFPLCEMGCAAWHPGASLRAGRAQMVVAAVLVSMADGLD
jgi:hypothetical protein